MFVVFDLLADLEMLFRQICENKQTVGAWVKAERRVAA
jgi:hypothetical protein